MFSFANLYKVISWAAVLLLLVLIFLLSKQPAVHSNELSKGVSAVIVEAIEKITNREYDLDAWNHRVRKSAHFILYAVLGLLLMNGFKASGASLFKTFLYSLGGCVLFAVSDEVHQLYVTGRGGQQRDVMIDSAGALLGVGVYMIFYLIIKGMKARH